MSDKVKDPTKKDLLAWEKAKDALAAAKKTEMDLRMKVCGSILGSKAKGTVHFKKFGLDATAVAKLNLKVDKDILKTIFKDLNADEKASIKYKPELKSKEYEALPENSILHKAVTSKAGTPALSIKELKQ